MAILVKTGLAIPVVAKGTKGAKAAGKGAKPKGKAAAAPKAAVAGFGDSGPIDLGMTRVIQQQTNWCWAACTVMVTANRTGQALDQSALANFRTKRADCSPANTFCNVTSNETEMQTVYGGAAHITATPTAITQAHAAANREALIRQMQTTPRPTPVQIGWAFWGGGRHVVVIGGYTQWQGDDYFWILNPAQQFPDGYWLRFDALYTADGTGDWILAITF